MHRRPEEKHHGGLWEFPGGKVESDENAADALARELSEELGIVVDPARMAACGRAEEGGGAAAPAIVIYLYTVREWDGEPVALEGGHIDWFAPHEIHGLDKPPLDVELALQLFRGSDEENREGGEKGPR